MSDSPTQEGLVTTEEQDRQLTDLVNAYSLVSEALDRLPKGRVALAVMHLEDSFTRATLAVLGGAVLPKRRGG